MKQKTRFKVGQRYNRLVITEFSHFDSHHRRHFYCVCDCGNTKVIQASLLSSGNTKSCGCFGTESRKAKRVSENHSEVTAIILGYQRHAVGRGLDFLLTRDFVINIIKQNCHYCGSPPNNLKITKNSIDGGLLYNGIDRVDSKKHYTNDNVVPCCSVCNLAKRAMSKEQFLNWVARVYNHQKAMAEQWG